MEQHEYQEGLIEEPRKTIEGHNSTVNCIIQLKDGRIVSSSLDNKVKFWDLATFYSVGTLKESNDHVIGLLQLYDERLVTTSWGCVMKVYDIYYLKCLQKIQLNNSVRSLIQLFSGGMALGAVNNVIELWDISTEPFVKNEELYGHSGGLLCLSQLIDGRLASGAQDNTLLIWDLQLSQSMASLKGHEDGVNSVVQIGDSTLVSASLDKTLRVWSIHTFECLTRISMDIKITFLIQLSNGLLCVGSFEGIIKQFNSKSYENEKTPFNSNHPLLALIQTTDGRIFYSFSNSIHILSV